MSFSLNNKNNYLFIFVFVAAFFINSTVYAYSSVVGVPCFPRDSARGQKDEAKLKPLRSTLKFTPPPIPSVNTSYFKDYVRKKHAFPSPFGYEPYRDEDNHEIKYPIKTLSAVKPYIPVTFYCSSTIKCPSEIYIAYGAVMFKYPDQRYKTLGVVGADAKHHALVGFYYPDDPKLYTGNAGFHHFTKPVQNHQPLVTILFSLDTLINLSQKEHDKFYGNLTANDVKIDLPLADGKESIDVGTTLSIIGLGVASGVEFSETISQTTGESFTHQVQTGFSLSVGFENDTTVGGGIVPVSDSFKFSVNSTLSAMISNSLQIDNEKTVSRTYTIKPGINDTYYWAIYQLLYSYRIDAPLLEGALNDVKRIWADDQLSFKIGDNRQTQDGKFVGNLLRPQSSQTVNDVTVGVAVPVDQARQSSLFSAVIK